MSGQIMTDIDTRQDANAKQPQILGQPTTDFFGMQDILRDREMALTSQDFSYFQLTVSPPVPPMLCGSISAGWFMSQPLLITLEQDEDGCYIVSDDQFAVYGDGDTPSEALQDYIKSLIDYYQLLATRTEGDPATEALFRRLQLYLRPVVE